MRQAALSRRARGAHPRYRSDDRYIRSDGYVLVRDPSSPSGWELEHRLVAGAKAGEVVHHINGDKTDNRPENLQVFSSQAEHRAHHLTLAAGEQDREVTLQA